MVRLSRPQEQLFHTVSLIVSCRDTLGPSGSTEANNSRFIHANNQSHAHHSWFKPLSTGKIALALVCHEDTECVAVVLIRRHWVNFRCIGTISWAWADCTSAYQSRHVIIILSGLSDRLLHDSWYHWFEFALLVVWYYGVTCLHLRV